ncbi:MAG: excinuclease ABC subunit C, partial [Candidatus Staskawiczbacteria bacterium]|nr:excinuclease ABC subunit C [Candidatus Staskawiczbacteria bacterium]
SHAGVIEPTKNQNASDWQKTQKILSGLLNLNKEVLRIECYDVSNIQGKQATGSMVVFVDSVADKSQYKKFKIKKENEPNDIAMLKETLQRRFLHKEWKYPEVILIDGGIAQLNVAIKVKNEFGADIKVISIAKKNKDLYVEGRPDFIPLKSLPREIYNLIISLDDEAHRFAIAYHKKLRKKSLLK